MFKKVKAKKFFIYDDLSNPNDLFNIKNVDSIIHLASITDAQQSILKKKIILKTILVLLRI